MKRPPFPTIGLLSTWPVYWGTTIDRHGHALMRGICAAARDRNCNLLLGAGVSPGDEPQTRRAAWPVLGAGTDFVPVGPWNTDGLIVLPDYMSPAQSSYVADLQASGMPVVFTTDEGPGPRVVADNANGIRSAVRHLVEHGHKRIAFIAGTQLHGGDSAARLRAFNEALAESGLAPRPRLIAFGEHNHDAGKAAMRQILAGKTPFTAFVASNDLSCLGAIEALREAGLRVPEDVAAIGFDDIIDSRSMSPALTTVRHASFELGYQAVATALDLMAGGTSTFQPVVVPTRLIVRESCGCRLDRTRAVVVPPGTTTERTLESLAEVAADAAYLEARQSTVAELAEQSRSLVEALWRSLLEADERPLRDQIASLLAATESRGEDPYAWQSALSELYRCSSLLVDESRGIREAGVRALLDRARIDVGDHIQRAMTRSLLDHMDMLSHLGLLTSRLLAATDEAQLARVLEADLPRTGISHFLVALYRGSDDEDDRVARSEIAMAVGLAASREGFDTRAFPPPGLYPGDRPVQLLILPVRMGDATAGFAAMEASNLEPSAAIVSNLGAAMRAIELYRQALEGRQLAEDANQLKSRFLSMVSHELRTPLSMVVGLSDIVLRETGEGERLSSEAARDLAQMSASARHLGRLIGDVLDLASSQVGHLALVRQRVDMRAVLLDAALAGEQLAREKGLEWHARIPSRPAWVMGDPTRLRQVVLNLIGNAVKFTDSGSVGLEAEVAEGEVRVSVIDTGAGIPADEIDLVFDEFHRSRDAIRRGLSGMGLGLAIARQLVIAHGGAIGVRSPATDGGGAAFWVTLPIAQAEAPAGDGRDVHPDVLLIAGRVSSEGWLGDQLRERGFSIRVVHVDPDEDWSGVLQDRMPSALLLDDCVAAGRGWTIVRSNPCLGGVRRIPVLACRLDPAGEAGGFVDLTHLLEPLAAADLAGELSRSRLTPAGSLPARVILAVDDDPDMLDFQTRVIRSAGAWPLRAMNGREALAVMAESRPDLVLLDLAMPEMDGFELLEAMRGDAGTRDIPVIVVTGRDVSDADLGRLNAYVAAILSKGVFTGQEIATRIEAVLSGAPALGATAQRLVRRAIVFIEEHYPEPITRDDIARHVAITGDYLTDCFHQELGITPISFLSRYRVGRARDMLETTDLPVTEVAMACGFSDVSHFIRTFHKEVGVSPRAYRRDRHLAAPGKPDGPS